MIAGLIAAALVLLTTTLVLVLAALVLLATTLVLSPAALVLLATTLVLVLAALVLLATPLVSASPLLSAFSFFQLAVPALLLRFGLEPGRLHFADSCDQLAGHPCAILFVPDGN